MQQMIRAFALSLLLFSTSIFAAPVNINTASADKIAQSLSGVGLKKAQRIVDYRTKNGKFKSLKALLKVKGIGQATLSKNKKDIHLK